MSVVVKVTVIQEFWPETKKTIIEKCRRPCVHARKQVFGFNSFFGKGRGVSNVFDITISQLNARFNGMSAVCKMFDFLIPKKYVAKNLR